MASPTDLQKKFYDMLLDSQWWSPADLQQFQRSQIAQLMRHARAQAPFYADRLDVALDPDGSVDWDRWHDIPILTRDDLVAHGDALTARELPPGHGGRTQSSTSGTSGAPVNVTASDMFHLALNASRFRFYHWHGVDTAEVCCSILGEDPDLAYPEGKSLGPWGPPWAPSTFAGELVRISRLTTVPQLLEFFARKDVKYLTTGSKSALALGLEMERAGLSYRFDAFLPHGSAVDPEDRDVVQHVFGAKTLDLYSSKEGGHMGHACPDGTGMHVPEETVLVELLDDDGRPVPAGTPGRVVITPFFNAAQPLVRYDQGDVARWTSTPCSCGRHLRTLDTVIGRSNTVFYHPDGRVRVAFMGHHRHLLNCSAWQIAQTGPTDFEVRYVPMPTGPAAREAELAARIRDAYFEDANVSYKQVESVSLTAAGKPQEYVNEWQPQGRPT